MEKILYFGKNLISANPQMKKLKNRTWLDYYLQATHELFATILFVFLLSVLLNFDRNFAKKNRENFHYRKWDIGTQIDRDMDHSLSLSLSLAHDQNV